MKKFIFFLASVFVAALVLTLAYSTTQGGQSGDVLFGNALHQEEVEGDYEAAIKTYEKLLAEYPDNRPLAAKAQFRIGVSSITIPVKLKLSKRPKKNCPFSREPEPSSKKKIKGLK